MNAVRVVGYGSLCALGSGADVLEGATAIQGTVGPRVLADFDPARSLQAKGLRTASRAAQLAALAGGDALRYPEPVTARPDRCGVVLGTRWASIEPLVDFDRRAAMEGPSAVNPSLFPNVVANTHAGTLGILFGFRGPNVTVCGPEAGLEAIGHAIDLIDLGRADLVLAGGVEALGPTMLEGLRRVGVSNPGEAAAFLVLSRSDHGIGIERSGPGAPAGEPEWAAASLEAATGYIGAAGGALAAVRAVRHAERGRGPCWVVAAGRSACLRVTPKVGVAAQEASIA